MNKRALVTGGVGFIDSHLVDRLVTDRFEVVALDNLSTGKLSNIREQIEKKDVRLINGDVKDYQVVRDTSGGIRGSLSHCGIHKRVLVGSKPG